MAALVRLAKSVTCRLHELPATAPLLGKGSCVLNEGRVAMGIKDNRRSVNRSHASQWSAPNVVMVVNGVLTGVAGVFLLTTSVPVTVVAAIAAILLASVILLAHR